jgi:hypothetical protein
MSWTDPSHALKKGTERRSVATLVGKACISRVWNRADSQGCRASRKSEKAPGGESGGGLYILQMGDFMSQPLGEGVMVTGTDEEGTGKLE